jgi:allantoinase
MKRFDLVLRGGMLVSPEQTTDGEAAKRGVQHTDVAILEGRVAALAPELEGASAVQEIDARGLFIFPGVLDAHVHFNEPGRTEWEGFASGSRALAAGGTTSYIEMPLNAHPPTLDAASFDTKVAAAEAASLVDFALWGGLVPGNRDAMDELAERGVVGFKAFLSSSGIDDFVAADDLTLYEGMARAAQLERVVAVHAENDAITGRLAQRAQASGRTGARDFLASRPVIAELEAIARAIFFAEETGCALHIVHVSTGRGVALVAGARQRGANVSCETCPHYLVLTEDDLERLGAVAKCAPPLRSAVEREALWGHLFAGTLPMVASDHSPAPVAMKQGDDFFRIWGGISGCQSLLALMLTEGYEWRDLPLATVAQVTAAFAADRFGLAPAKGRIAVGADADLALVDLDAHTLLRAEDLHYRHRQSPYVGMRLRGRVVRTLVRGETVYANGIFAAAARGRLLRPTQRAEALSAPVQLATEDA